MWVGEVFPSNMDRHQQVRSRISRELKAEHG